MSIGFKDLVFNYDLLYANGRSDAENGIDRRLGWKEIVQLTGYSDERTPAREAYEDGWFSFIKEDEGQCSK